MSYLDEFQHNEKTRLTMRLRKRIKNYNNNVLYNQKRVETENNSYFELYNLTSNVKGSSARPPLNRMSIIYRLSHSTDQKYLKLYQDLKTLITDRIGFKFKDSDDEFTTINEIFRLYHEHNTESDTLENQLKKNFAKYFPDQTVTEKVEDYHELHRALEKIDSQSSEIFSIPFQVEKQNFKEFKFKENIGLKTFRALATSTPYQFYDEGESSEEDETLVHKPKKVKRPDNVEIVNYFAEFYEKHKHMIFARDYWALFLNDVINEIKSQRSNEDLFTLFASPDYFNNVDAAEYFIKHRKEIIDYCSLVADQLPAFEEMRRPKIEFMDPMTIPNTEVAFLLDISDRDLQAEASKHKAPVKREHKFKADPDLDDDGRVDFVKMNIQKLLNCLPFNSERKETENYVLFNLPPPLKDGKAMDESKLIAIDTLEGWAQKVFTGVKFLNTIQSKVKYCAYDTNENMLVSAPTGAGKTNIALLAIAHEIKKIIDPVTWQLKKDDLKVIYVSPMKALAAEIVDKFSERLNPIKINVRELTGDMQLTKQEIQDTQVIVTTPEKWDVITRKSDGITAKLRLIIIDEIHLLNDDRGPVLEAIVARTLRMVERTQQRVRLIGLSATLPNPIDVAEFLRVDLEKGFFYFDASFRPIPLHQRYVGVKEDRYKDSKLKGDKCEFNLNYSKKGDHKLRVEDVMNDICFDIVRRHVASHSQVMVFVHSRKETMKFAIWLLERFKERGEDHFLLNSIHRDNTLGRLNHKELIKVCPTGIGFHNAGLLRQDRNIVEKLFLEGNLRILVTTATLAWGVNLPAHAVVIKGTDVYEPNYGDFIDLSILDIQQIFGRAGRPQFDTRGEATLITRVNKVNYYMGLLTNTQDIESQFLKSLKEALNAEISLGTVTNVYEAKEWLKYTFFYRRLVKRPDYYIPGFQKKSDPKAEIEAYLDKTITQAVETLHKLRLIRYDQKSLFLYSTDLGGIASRYYIKAETMEHFENELHLNDEKVKSNEQYQLEDENLLSIISRAKEFENIKLRNEEFDEVNKIMRMCFMKLDKPYEATSTDKNVDKNMNEQVYEDFEKVFVLIQGYLMHCVYENSSLVADTIYIVQNSMRILRCMMEICMKKNMSQCFQKLLYWSKLIEMKMTPDDHPLSQFTEANNFMNYSAMRTTNKRDQKHGLLSNDLFDSLRDTKFEDFYKIREADANEISKAMGLKDRGQIIKKFASYIPELKVKYLIKPIAQAILKIEVNIDMEMTWNPKWHTKNEFFWLLVDDEVDLLHIEQISISTMHVNEKKKSSMFVSFYIPFQEDSKRQYRLIIESDRWIGSWYEEYLDLSSFILNKDNTRYTKLLDLDPLPKAALNNKDFEALYKFDFFNPIQTQVFHALYHTDNNVLVGAPTGSGKTNIAELAILRVFNKTPTKKVVYIAPLKALTRERIQDWRERLEEGTLKKKVLELTGDFTPDMDALKQADVIVSTPEKWDGISRSWQNRSYVQNVGLVILDEIHLLGQERGPVIEAIVSRMNYIAKEKGVTTRMVGLSTALANGADVANWFGVKPQYFFNFKPQVRPCPITIYFEGFSERNYYPRMSSMNKPAYNAIKQHGQGKPTLMFVSSRRQTRLTAHDMVSLIYSDSSNGGNFTQFLGTTQMEINVYRQHIQDPDLKETLTYGIGIHHAGLSLEDRNIVEQLFLKNKIQILIATSTLAWGVNFPAHLVIIKGTEFFDPKTKKYVDFPVVDLLQMIGRAGRPQFDTHGIACVFLEASKKNFYRKYLSDPFPVESNLESHISNHLNSEIASRVLKTKASCFEYLTWTFYFRRIIKNPTYYGVSDISHDKINEFIVNTIDKSLKDLQKDGCIKITDDFYVEPTLLGEITSLYYIKHSTTAYFNKALKPDLSIIDLVKILSNAREFDEVPLRHGEEEINEKFFKQCPYQIGEKAYDTSHFKTFLLLQMYFSRLAPPVRDFLSDAKTIIDGCVRVIQAMIDIAADKGYLGTVTNLCYIMQMVVQGAWHNDSHFKNLPHFNDAMIKSLEGEKVTQLAQLIELTKKKELRNLLKKVNPDLKDNALKEIEDCLDYIPDVKFAATLKPIESKDKEETEALVKVDLKRENSQYPLTVKLERYKKIKACSWWIICSNPKENELLSLRKVNFKDTVQKDIKIILPKSFDEKSSIDVHLVSDSYIGIDQKLSIPLNSS